MNVMPLFDAVHMGLYSTALASARLFPAFILLPWLNSSVVPGVIKFPLVLLLGSALWPFPGEAIYQLHEAYLLLLIFKEVVIGLILAIFLCFPFWVMHAAGSLIDNQRGATLSSTISPMSGVDTSELANLFNLLAVALILQAGGALTFVQVMHNSYQLLPPLDPELPFLSDILRFTGATLLNAVKIAAPVITVFLVTEVILGLLSRYAPQMNAFSLALVLKSFIGFLILLIYLGPTLSSELLRIEKLFLRPLF
ncbi:MULTISPECIES: type III secretion system export apparatus subunit SctT [unclassified Pantoea]|uniref:type III secretion system export apparatus subunit SctT n=1 Tax=unclassified Pantoea TaxID=2630326 RepID=UPI001CC1D8AB|nr:MULTISPECIES: type III secretion system export apparatus subunit SctT [unclassified Pantoea]